MPFRISFVVSMLAAYAAVVVSLMIVTVATFPVSLVLEWVVGLIAAGALITIFTVGAAKTARRSGSG